MIKTLSISLLLLFSTLSFAELEELDDEALSAIEGQGLVIDMEYELYIGEIAFKFADSQESNGFGSDANSGRRLQDRK